MSSTLTLAHIRAAQANDLEGISAVLAEMNSRLDGLAAQTASTLATNPARYADYVADFRQDAAVALFEYLPMWQGDSVDSFRAYLYGAIAGVLKERAHAERNGGADRDAISVLKSVMEQAGGDVYKAERLAQTEPRKGLRLSADRAFAARIAWQGAVSIDKQAGEDEGSSILHTLAVTDEAPDVVRPKVGRGAVLEALSVLERHVRVPRGTEEREALFKALEGALTGFVTPDQVDAIAEAVTVPAEPTERRYILDAVAILYSAGSTAQDGDLAEELRDVSDDRRDVRAVKVALVREVLASMGEGQRMAVALSFGIGDVKCYGHGDGADSEGLAAELGTSVANARPAKTKGLKAFAKRWIAKVARTEAEALSWAEAASLALARGGRK
jgi:hypothetical protein